MKHTKIIAVLISLGILCTFASCSDKNQGNDSTTNGTGTELTSVTDVTENNASEKESTTAAENTTDEETTAPEKKFVFDEKKAIEIGKFNSEIYGKLVLYFQDNMLALKDEFNDVKFALNSEGFSPSGENDLFVIGEDMNFDGYTDFRLLSSLGVVNAYYYCWIWDMNAKTFKYYYPLSSISSPEFNKDSKEVISTNRSSAAMYDVSTYKWVDGQLTLQKHETVTSSENAPSGSEIAENDTVEITNGLSSYITLYGNPGSQCRWLPIVENAEIVDVVSQSYDETTGQTRIMFEAHGIGTTTVVVRFALDRNSDYVSQKVFNVTADEDLTVTIREIK